MMMFKCSDRSLNGKIDEVKSKGGVMIFIEKCKVGLFSSCIVSWRFA